MNNARTTANFRYGYCTVMFFSENIESLPNPFAIGDILYLRRYIFSLVKDSHLKSMMKASKPEITHQIIVHGPCYMVMSKIKILLNINFQKLSSISINKNTAQWKKTLEISDNLPEDFWVNTQFCWPFQPVSTQKIKISLFKSLEKMNKEFLESEMEKDNWLLETAQLLLKKKKSVNWEVSLKSERMMMVKMKSLITTSLHFLDFHNGLLMLNHSFNKKTPWKLKSKQKCILTSAFWILLL